MEYNFTDRELKLLNSNLAIKLLLQQEEIDPVKVLRYVKYEKQIERLQVELIQLQQWVIENNKRVCILFEGRDAAGKGGAIRRITHHLNPRNYRVVALPKPNNVEGGQWYFQRYINKLPNQGEIVLFDRSWYNRAIVEPLNGFCTNEEYEMFLQEVVNFENMITRDGLILIKFYFSISKKEQANRFSEIKSDPLKSWKLSPIDDEKQVLWDKNTAYKERMFKESTTKENPWVIIKANRKTQARIEAINYILKSVPYKPKK